MSSELKNELHILDNSKSMIESQKITYQKYLNRQDRAKIISQIQASLLNIYYNISQIELDILSENFYDYCCLIIYDIPKQEIIKYILEKNNKIYEVLTKKQRECMILEPNIKIFKLIIKKYTKVLKDNNKMTII